MATKSNQRDIKWGDGYVTARVLKSGQTVYQARWKEPHPLRGTIWKSKTFHDEELAYDHLRDIGRKKRRGAYAPESEITLSEAVAEYAESRLELEKWTENTYFTNLVFKERLIDPQIGKIRVTRLTVMQLQQWANSLAKEKATSTVRSTLSIIRGTLRRQIQFGVIQSNPAVFVEVQSRQTEERNPWTLDDIRTILNHTRTDLRLHTYYLLSFTTGMRPGELRALRWSDVDWERNAITCQRTITKDRNGKEIVGVTTKTGKSRVIALGQSTMNALRKWKVQQNEIRLMQVKWHDTIIFDRGDGRFMPGTTLVRRHRAVVAESGVHPESPHNTRHSYATLEDEFGTTTGVTRARLGHASENMTLRYTHAQLAAQVPVAEHMSGLLSENSDEPEDDEEIHAQNP